MIRVVNTSGARDDRRENRNNYMSPPWGPASAQAAFRVEARLIRVLYTAIIAMNTVTVITKNPKTSNIVNHGITGNIGIGYISDGPVVDPPAIFTVMLRNKGA